MSKYNVGDKVKIIDHRGRFWNNQGEMDKYCGETLTIERKAGERYFMKECPEWFFDDYDISEIVEQKVVTK